jgi:2,3-bisphosphoglycerate-dependent phosphoglycerate mutase
MSDLQCPATMLIAHHGEVTNAGDGVASAGGTLTDQGRRQVHALVEQVRGRRVAAVYSSRMGPAFDSAQVAASELGLSPVVAAGLPERTAVGAQDDQRAVTGFTEAIGEIADTHRGETVLVFTEGSVMSLVIPVVCVNVGNDPAAQRIPAHCAVAEVEVDADGWRLVSWLDEVSSEQA